MKNKKLLFAAVAFVAVIAIVLGVYLFTRPDTVQGAKTITVTVIHKDDTKNSFVYHTDEEYLGPVLLSEGLVQGTEGPYGLMISTVDGETADYNVDQGWWQIFVGEEPAITGADAIVIADGDSFKLVYTIG